MTDSIDLSEEELKNKFIEGVKIMNRLRYWTLKWEAGHGVELKVNKKYWEKRADEWLEGIVEIKNKSE